MTRSLLAIVFLFLAVSASAQEQADKPKPDIPPLVQNADLEKRARDVARTFREEKFVDLVGQMSLRVRGVLGVADGGATSETVMKQRRSSVRAILFVSSSVPLQTLRAYAQQLEKVNGVIVFRGMPNGLSSMKPMIKLTQNILLRDPSCNHADCDVFDIGVIVDPLMFKANGVDMVPAVTLVDQDPFAAYCERPTEEQAGSMSAFVTFGDAHLSGHFDALSRLGDKRASSLLNLLENGDGE